MANELAIAAPGAGLTIYAHLFNHAGSIWNGTSFETYASGNYANYDIATSQLGSSRYHTANMPATIPAGEYRCFFKLQSGGSPAEGDALITSAASHVAWDGNALVGTSYDAHLAKAALANKQNQTISSGVVAIRNNADDGTLVTLTPSVDDNDNPTINTLTPS